MLVQEGQSINSYKWFITIIITFITIIITMINREKQKVRKNSEQNEKKKWEKNVI